MTDPNLPTSASEIATAVGPEVRSVIDHCLEMGSRGGFSYVTPTPLVDPFWRTTFAPSSSEIIFRIAEATSPDLWKAVQKRVTIQPCVRFNDLASFSDGIHQVGFHMATHFWMFESDVREPLAWAWRFLGTLNVPDHYTILATCHTPSPHVLAHRPLETGLTQDVLLDVGIPAASIVPACSHDTYHADSHRSETKTGYEAWGPRVEFYAVPNDGSALRPIEIATFVFEECLTPEQPGTRFHVCALASGIERSAMCIAGRGSYWDIPAQSELCSTLLTRLSSDTRWRHIYRHSAAHFLELLLSLLMIRRAAPNVSPGEKGVQHQLRRIVRAANRVAQDIGIPGDELSRLLADIPSIDSSEELAEVVQWLNSA